MANNVKSYPFTGLYGSRRLRLPEFLYSWHIKVVRFSALLTGHLYPTEDICVVLILLEAESTPGP
jgi:hypothetical protein